MSKNQIIVLVAVLVVVVVIIIVAYNYMKKDKTEETTTTTSQSSTTGLSALLSQPGTSGALSAILSDERFKENIMRSDFDKTRFMSLVPFSFMYRRADGTSDCGCGCKGKGDCQTKVGFIAQEVEKAEKSLVSEKDGVKYVDYAMITALNTEALRDTISRLDRVEKMLTPATTAK
jgi:hypothetical protein